MARSTLRVAPNGAATWSKRDVLKAVLRRQSEGLPLNATAVVRQQAGLYRAARRWYGQWDHALRAAGIDPVRVRRRIQWSCTSIVQRIRQLAREGQPLNSRAVQRSESSVVCAAARRFGSWDNALLAAGMDPQQCRLRRLPWTPEQIIEAIVEIHAKGGKLNAGVREIVSMKLAAVRLFASWDAALQATGLDPEEIRNHRKPWTAEAVLEEIRKRHRRGKALHYASSMPVSLRESGTRLFGSWDEALIAAGLDPARIRKRPPVRKPWTSQDVLQEIQRKCDRGEPLNAGGIWPKSLYDCGRRFFGSWDAALTAAGLDPREHRRSRLPWTRQRLVEAIRQIHSRGGKLNHGGGICSTMAAKATRLFGSWDAALQAAGLDPTEIRLHRKRWTAETMIQEIRLRQRNGYPLNCTSVQHSSLYIGAVRHFGSWDSALMAAGLDPAKTRKIKPHCRPWTPETVVQEIRRKRQAAEPLNRSAVSPESLCVRGSKFYGSWDAALTAAGLDPSTIRKHRPGHGGRISSVRLRGDDGK